MIHMKGSNGKCIADLTRDELKEIHEAHQNYLKDMEMKNTRYYLQTLRQFVNKSEGFNYLEAVYSNGLKEIVKKWAYGQSIPTIIYDNE